ncbi:hypothetical protein GCM10027589_40560 [Actinocorallia lasiicapitis]
MIDRKAGRNALAPRLAVVLGVVAAAAIGLLVFLNNGGGKDGTAAIDVPVAPVAVDIEADIPPSDEASAPAGEGFEGMEPDVEESPEPQATAMSGRTHAPNTTPNPSPSAVKQGSVDGCDHSYGPGGSCVPWTFPEGVTTPEAKCGWLKESGFALPIAVRGADRHELDPDKDGLGCETD